MAKAIRIDSRNNRTTGISRPGTFSGRPGSVRQQVHDGDTLTVGLDGNLGVRLLGIDTPEVSFAFPGPKLNFKPMDAAEWGEFLESPFDDRWGSFASPVSDQIRGWIESRLTGEPALIHNEHADAATSTLRGLIDRDMEIMGQDVSTFSYYMGFGFEVMDGYGRLLCSINRNQPKQGEPTRRPPSYNLRLLERGRAFPYFIWPNVSPWDRPDSVEDSVIPPGQVLQLAKQNRELRTARSMVKAARARHLGVFDAVNPCLLEPFELRFLSRRSLPTRYLINLESDEPTLLPSSRYTEVPHSEDRLWIPYPYVPLFEKHGWELAE